MKHRIRSIALAAILLPLANIDARAGSRLPIYSRPVLLETIEQWKVRDGALAGEISDYWCDFVVESPDVFLKAMKERSHIFTEWVKALSDLSFTDHGGCVDLECRRRRMIKTLESASDTKLRRVAKPLLDRLRAIRVVSID